MSALAEFAKEIAEHASDPECAGLVLELSTAQEKLRLAQGFVDRGVTEWARRARLRAIEVADLEKRLAATLVKPRRRKLGGDN